MRSIIACIAALILLGGCGLLKDRLGYTDRGMLAEATAQLRKGNETAVAKLLENIANSVYPVEGITDEALFRLSILELRKQEDAAAMNIIQKRLNLLQTNYPASLWSRMSWPLTEYLTQTEALKAESLGMKQKINALSKDNRELTIKNQQLQGANQTLIRENREFKQHIEKLKSLDMELEKKIRH